jgi:hypothetical protein
MPCSCGSDTRPYSRLRLSPISASQGPRQALRRDLLPDGIGRWSRSPSCRRPARVDFGHNLASTCRVRWCNQARSPRPRVDWLARSTAPSSERRAPGRSTQIPLEVDRARAPGRPLVDTITSSKIKRLKELRPGSSDTSEIRILFVSAPWRSAIVLVAGDKSGKWNRWYAEAMPHAEQLYESYLKERAEEETGR